MDPKAKRNMWIAIIVGGLIVMGIIGNAQNPNPATPSGGGGSTGVTTNAADNFSTGLQLAWAGESTDDQQSQCILYKVNPSGAVDAVMSGAYKSGSLSISDTEARALVGTFLLEECGAG